MESHDLQAIGNIFELEKTIECYFELNSKKIHKKRKKIFNVDCYNILTIGINPKTPDSSFCTLVSFI